METEMPANIKKGHRAIWLALIASTCCLLAADPKPKNGEMPRLQPLATDKALASFQVRDGFKMQLVAAEPLVADPMALTFDEFGRLYVVEMHGYPEKRHEKIGKVRLLTDEDGDGIFDNSTVFAEKLGWPSAIIAYDGGVFVGCAPNIYFMRDNDGDGIAEEKTTVFTGFRTGSPREIAPRLFNSFRWGYDNRIYGASSMNGGIVRRPDQPEAEAINLTRDDFSFDPRTFDLRPESGTAQHGMSFDLRGIRYASRNSNHIMAMVYDSNYANRNPDYNMPHWRADIAVEGPAAKVYRISPPEPWRVLRTRWRVGGQISGPIEGGGTAFGYFTSATGVTIYRGDAYPASFVGNAFVAAPANNLIHRKSISLKNPQPVARRADPQRRAEFIASTDNFFRPVQFVNGPDGCLYVADMYRETIEVAHAIPESIKAHMDIYSGTDRGRIYRILPNVFKPRPLPNFRKLKSPELVSHLSHPNGWHRDTAARLLFERNTSDAAKKLRETLLHGSSFPAQIHALHLLNSFDRLTAVDLQAATEAEAPGVREHAIRIMQTRLKQVSEKALAEITDRLVRDPDARVRFQLALTLGASSTDTATAGLANLARNENDPWMNGAILSGINGRTGEFLVQALSHGVNSTQFEVSEVFAKAIELIGQAKDTVGIKAILRLVQESEDAADCYRATIALGTGLRKAKTDFEAFGKAQIISDLLEQAKTDVQAGDIEVRTNAIAFLALGKPADVGNTLYGLLDRNETLPDQLAALKVLDQFTSPEIATQILDRWNTFTPGLRREASRLLLRRASHTKTLLKRIEQGSIGRSAVPFNRRNALRRHRDAEIQAIAQRMFGSPSVKARREVVSAYRPALHISGNARAGQKTYEERCQTCHAFKGVGHAMGPDLETIRAWTAEEILLHILDPNLKVEPNHRAYTIDLGEEESYTGIIKSESSTGVTLRMPNGIERRIPRRTIRSLKDSGLSIMPEGLEENLTQQAMADLIAYLKN